MKTGLTLDEVDWNEYPYEIQQIAKQLNCARMAGIPYPEGSIMAFGEVCECRSGFLCEHRLIWILNNIDVLVSGADLTHYSFEDH